MTTAQRNEIESLLEEPAETRRRIYVAQTYGVRPEGLRDVKGELHSTRQRLAALTR